ncbi:MAG: NgoFVII family restriction endonuclease [Treponema sp.]|nr:NgoFVII family restriction endonuclease [Treponema sp.]
MLITNIGTANTLDYLIKNKIKTLTALDICVGYCGKTAIHDYYDELLAVSSRGRCRLILGMYSHQGAFINSTSKKPTPLKLILDKLNTDLRKLSSSSGVFITKDQFHGKIYNLEYEGKQEIYLGSCNFSLDGLGGRREAQILAPKSDNPAITAYINSLASKTNAIDLQLLSTSTPPTVSGLRKLHKVSALPSYLTKDRISGTITLRVDEQPKSGLNLCFSSGRINKYTGKYTPRPWYEVELSIDEKERNQPIYPKINNAAVTIKHQKTRNRCIFKAYLHYRHTDKFYSCTMATYSDQNKAMCSDGDRRILGEFIKSRLENLGLLKVGDKITSDVLNAYGFNNIELERYTDPRAVKTTDPLSDKVYVITF